MAHLRRPLQQVVDRGIVAAVVEVLGEIGIAHHAPVEIEHLHVPILTAAERILRFGHDVCAVLGQFAVAQHIAGTTDKAQAVGLRIVEAGDIGRFGAKGRMLVTPCGSKIFEHGLACGVQTQAHCAASCRHEEIASARRRFDAPHLVFVRTVDFAGFNAVAGETQRALREGIDDAPCARERCQRPELFAASGIDLGGAHHVVAHIEHFLARCGRRKPIERTFAPLGRIGARTEGKSAQQERAKSLFDHVHGI